VAQTSLRATAKGYPGRDENGSTRGTPAYSKSAVFRVTIVKPCCKADAAIKLSLTGMERPHAFNRAKSSAHAAAVPASSGITGRTETAFANHSSRSLRLRPGGINRMPYSISPYTIGVTTMFSA
jgi:hypothetical protein